ncbi:MAG: DUF4411 family protein [Ekhidna sp.]|nr:DUF4411 family protein [Ekhidna sp.]
MRVYVVDSNFFIQAHRATYPPDVVKSFWTKVHELAEAGTIVSIDKVQGEICDKNDPLERWCTGNLPSDFFRDSSSVLKEYGQISEWANSKKGHYQPEAINEFLDADEADAFLVAYALQDIGNRVLVTHEVSEPNRKNKVKIPEPCDEFEITYMNTIQMFRELGVTF